MPALESNAPMHRVVVAPHRSITWRGLWCFYASLTTVSLAVALWFTLHGYWPVLLFAMGELALVGVSLGLGWRQGNYVEVITLQGDRLVVMKTDGRRRECHEYNRHWAQVVEKIPDARLHPRRLVIRSHGRECEVGVCLSEAEREDLMRRLAGLVRPGA